MNNILSDPTNITVGEEVEQRGKKRKENSSSNINSNKNINSTMDEEKKSTDDTGSLSCDEDDGDDDEKQQQQRQQTDSSNVNNGEKNENTFEKEDTFDMNSVSGDLHNRASFLSTLSSSSLVSTGSTTNGTVNAAGMKTEWEEGLDCIDSLLQEESATLHAMTDQQQHGLRKVKEMLLSRVGTMGGSSSCATLSSHVPRALLDADSRSSAFILQEYAGYTQPMTDANMRNHNTTNKPAAHKLSAIIKAHSLARKLSKRFKVVEDIEGDITNIPYHWKTLTQGEQLHLRDLLSWDNLCCWKNFNIFDVHKTLQKKHTLVFVAWAILASPVSQHSMDIACKDFSDKNIMNIETRDGYDFTTKLGICEPTLVKFLYALEARYNQSNPYHNEVHAADVTQSLHALLQMGGVQFAEEKWEAFAVLMAAVGHDVDHCGMNNNFHINSRSKLALTYNDDAILENHHASVFFSLIQGETRQEDLDIFEAIGPEKGTKIREFIIQVILSTDMTKHFKKNDCIKSIMGSGVSAAAHDGHGTHGTHGTHLGCHYTDPTTITQQRQGAFMKSQTLRHEVLSFLCHMADISNPTKSNKVMTRWTTRVMEEFYRQGDKERTLELPISPCCDRTSQKIEDVQIGFINFIVLPSFKLCGDLLPEVSDEIVPQITHNLRYWKKKQKQEAAAAAQQTQTQTITTQTITTTSAETETTTTAPTTATETETTAPTTATATATVKTTKTGQEELTANSSRNNDDDVVRNEK